MSALRIIIRFLRHHPTATALCAGILASFGAVFFEWMLSRGAPDDGEFLGVGLPMTLLFFVLLGPRPGGAVDRGLRAGAEDASEDALPDPRIVLPLTLAGVSATTVAVLVRVLGDPGSEELWLRVVAVVGAMGLSLALGGILLQNGLHLARRYRAVHARKNRRVTTRWDRPLRWLAYLGVGLTVLAVLIRKGSGEAVSSGANAAVVGLGIGGMVLYFGVALARRVLERGR